MSVDYGSDCYSYGSLSLAALSSDLSLIKGAPARSYEAFSKIAGSSLETF